MRIRSKDRARSKGDADPLASARETGKLFQQLQSDPFGTVAAIAADEGLKKLDAKRKAELADLITQFTTVATQASSGMRLAERQLRILPPVDFST